MGAWYVVRTKTGGEERSTWHLKNQGFEAYLPRYRKQVRHARKTEMALRPLFPGYVFVRLDIGRQRWRAINGTFGVIGIVQFGDTPQAIPERMVQAIRAREDAVGAVDVAPQGLQKGDRVRVREGAFAEYTALLGEVSDGKRVTLLLDLMGREVRISVNMENLAKAS